MKPFRLNIKAHSLNKRGDDNTWINCDFFIIDATRNKSSVVLERSLPIDENTIWYP